MAGGRDGGRGLQGRVQLRSARDQLPLRRRAAHRRPTCDLQERRQGDRRAGRHGDHLHGQVQRARGQLVPHPFLAGRRRRAIVPARRGAFERSWPVSLRPARDDACSSRPTSTPTSDTRRLVRADRGRLGARQPHLLAARRRPRPVAAFREPRRRCGPQPVSGAGAIIAAGLHGVDSAWSSEPAFEGDAYSAEDLRACRRRCAPPASCSPPSEVARDAFGEEVVAHYVNAADVELAAFQGGDRLGARPGVRTAVTGSCRRVSEDAVFARSARRPRSRRRSSGSAPRSSSGCSRRAPGCRLSANCARKLGIARSTLRQALLALGQTGHLYATRGRARRNLRRRSPAADRAALGGAAQPVA